MPQAVGIFPAIASSSSSRASFAPSNDGGPSKFDDALDGARHADSSNSTDSSSPADPSDATSAAKSTKSAEKGSKSAKTKSTGAATAKSVSKGTAKKSTKTETKATTDEDADASTADVPHATADETAEHSAATKSKDAAHAAHVAEHGAATAQPAILPPSTNGVKSPAEESNQAPEDGSEHPSKDQEPVEAIVAEDNGSDGNADHPAEASPAAAGHAATPAPTKHSAELASANPALQGIQATSASPQDTTAEDVASTGEASAAAVSASDGAASTADVASANATVAAGSNGNPASPPIGHSFADVLSSVQGPQPTAKTDAPAPAAPVHAPPAPREVQFAAANHAQIVTGIQGQLLPSGGSMQLHLNPAELGSMSVSVHIRDGVMTATFDTSNDQATRLVTHSLGQLKTALESQGMSVGGLHVQQTPRDSQTSSGGGEKGSQGGTQEKSSQQQQEQQRKEMLRRMWRRLNGGKDPLDLVA